MYLVYCNSIDSTQLLAKRIFEKIQKEILVVTSDTQLSGFGRNSRKWISGCGGLYFTSAFKNIIFPHPIPLYISISVCLYLKKKFNINARLKWPNDVYFENKKLGGILIDRCVSNDFNFLFLGIGLNYNNEIEISGTENNDAISIKQILGSEITFSNIIESKDITEFILTNTESYKNNQVKLINDYSGLCICLNKKIEAVDFRDEKIFGTASAIGTEGELILNCGRKLFSVKQLRIII